MNGSKMVMTYYMLDLEKVTKAMMKFGEEQEFIRA
jgi:hypothetical protein